MGKMRIESDTDDMTKILKLAYGGKAEDVSDGGMVEGDSHEEGGVPVTQKGTGEQIAEVEGGERVFSTEDTASIEQAAEQIHEHMGKGDRSAAEDLAMRLGFAVVDMLSKQEAAQAEQEQQMQGQEAGMNSFGGEPDNAGYEQQQEDSGFTI